jgi:hypothetical protein
MPASPDLPASADFTKDTTDMRDRVSIRKAVLEARHKHDQIANDRRFGDGYLGDEELTDLLLVPYPTVVGQRN